jgi:hypothetical protein
MVTIILAIALLIAIAGLSVEIGVASWNIRRANRCQRRESVVERASERVISERQDNDYMSDTSWLLNFLYNRYGKFADLETEIQDGLKGVTEYTPIGEAAARYKDLKKALKLIGITVKASEHEKPDEFHYRTIEPYSGRFQG